jgi:hypothetical protein
LGGSHRVFCCFFHIYTRERYWTFFVGWRCTDSEYLFVGLVHDGLFDPTTMQREESTTNDLRNSRRNQSSAKQALGIVNWCQSECHAVSANHLPPGMVKSGPVLVA